MKKVKQMPVSNRPREKLCEKGPKALTDKELLAVLLGNGTRTQDVFTLAGRILKVVDDTNAAPTLEQLQTIAGIGPAKAKRFWPRWNSLAGGSVLKELRLACHRMSCP